MGPTYRHAHRHQDTTSAKLIMVLSGIHVVIIFQLSHLQLMTCIRLNSNIIRQKNHVIFIALVINY